MDHTIISIDKVRREAREAAQHYSDVNDACPYPFCTEAGRVFRSEFNTHRAALGVAPELTP